jgi:hypothetical protein
MPLKVGQGEERLQTLSVIASIDLISKSKLRKLCKERFIKSDSLYPESADLLPFVFEKFTGLDRKIAVSEPVLWQLIHASCAYEDEGGVIVPGEGFAFEHLKEKDIADLYLTIRSYNQHKKRRGEKTFLGRHEFDLKDAILR